MLTGNQRFAVSIFVTVFIVLGIYNTSYADITPMSERTSQVRDAIVTAVPGINSADDVTEAHLTVITSLNLRNAAISVLNSGDFSGLTGLTSLNLYGNELSSLPDGIFEGLTALTTLRLGGNTVDPMPISVSLEKVGDTQFKAVVPTGALFDIVLPISSTNGTIASGVTTITIAKGSTESTTLIVSRRADTTAAVTANIGTLPSLPLNHYGYVLTKSNVLPLEVLSAVTTTPSPIDPPIEPPPVDPPIEPPPVDPPIEPPPVDPPTTNTAPVFTDGTAAIRSIAENAAAGTNIGTAVSATDANENDTLTYTLGGIDAASFEIDSTNGQLKTKNELDYEMKRVYTATISVSDGTLTDTVTVIISVIDVDDTVVSAGFVPVAARTPQVRDAIVAAMPNVTDAASVTESQVAAITNLNLRGKGISSLKTGDFSGMTGLTSLNLYGNMLSTLPMGVFEGLSSLNSLRLGGNLIDPLPLIVSVQQIDVSKFRAVVHTGAPFDIVLPVGAMMVTIPKGSLTSAAFTALSTPNINALPALPANHFGYVLAKSTVCNRTIQVSDAIVNALPGIDDCRNVSEVHLATITSLNLSNMSLTSLKIGDFAGMLSLTTLNLDNNQLSSLPDGIFDGLTALTTVDLSGNFVSPLPLSISLQMVGSNQIKAVVPTGAPFDIVLPITVANGSSDGSALTISTGNDESQTLTVTRTSGMTAAVTVDIALPSLPISHRGYALVKSNLQPLEVFEDINIAPVFTEGATATRTIAENTPVDTNIGTSISATDANNDTLTYSLSATDATYFSIVSTSGQLKTHAALDYENITSYSVIVTVSDGTLTDSIVVTVNVTNVDENRAPVFTDGESTTRTVAENTVAGTNIGAAVAATDADGNTLTYSLGGTDAASFDIDTGSGQLKTRAALDYESKDTYSVTVTASDGKLTPTSIIVTIKVTDVDETTTVTPRDPDAPNNAPEFTDGESTTRTVAENTGSGVNIGSAMSATDADNDTLTYSLDGTDASSFSINGSNGQLRTRAALDYETDTSYSVSVTVSDGKGGSDSISVTIKVTDVDETTTVTPRDPDAPNNAPEFTDGESTTRTVAENTGSGVNIGSVVSATDADNDTLTYSLDGTDASSFSINSTNGQLRTRAALDYETDTSYSVSVTVSDGKGGSDSISVTINITDVDEALPNNAPVFTDGESTTRTVAENTGSGVNIGSVVSATDADNDTLTYSLDGTDASSFSINGSNGQLRTRAALDYETDTSYSVSVTVSDGKGGSDSISVTINITDVDEALPNNAPVFTDGESTTRTVAENTGSGVNIGSAVSATDADNDTLTYSLGGTDASSFSINGSNGQLQTSGSLDHEVKSSYSVSVTVSDGKGGSDSISVTINVTNVNEAPAFLASTTTRTIAENVGVNINIGSAVNATDPDTDDSLTYTLSGTDANSFAIEETTGQLKTKAALDFEIKTSYTVIVTVKDAGNLSDTITVTINVTDLDETPSNNAPVFTEGNTTTRSIAENTAADSNIGNPITATDTDSTALAYVLSGDDASSFSIDLSSGQLKTNAPLNHEIKLSYAVTVEVSDGSLKDTIDVTITVTDVNETPIFAAESATRSVAENTAANTNIGAAFSASDLDGDDLTYTLGGTDASSFSIGSTNGQLRTDAALDYETKNVYSVTVTVSDDSLTDTINITIRVTDVNENRAPVFTEGTSTTRSVAENTVSGVDIGSAVGATDADSGDTLTYSLGGTDASSFSIDSTDGQLRTNAALDYETKNAYSVMVTVSDGNGGTDSITVTIRVTDINENHAPVFTEGTSTTRSVAENTVSGVDIGSAVAATDADSDDTLTYSLGGTDAASFGINSTTGQLRTSTALDYETKTSYSVTLTVSDGSLTDSINVTINVTDVNEAPVFTNNSFSYTIDMSTATVGAAIGAALTATDPDNDTLTFSVEGSNASFFSIISDNSNAIRSGQLQVTQALIDDTRNNYSINVIADDGEGGTAEIAGTIDVFARISTQTTNNSPVFTDGNSTTRSVAENTAAGENIGDPVVATDADSDDILTYTLGGTDASSFSINSTTGQLRTNAALDYETKTSYTVIVSVSDGNGGSDRITVTINVTDVDENRAPVFASERTTRSVAENTAAGENIGNPVGATDADNDTLTYTLLGGVDEASFSIVSTSGQLQTSAALDYETKTSYSVTVSVSDGRDGRDGSDTIIVTIDVTDVDEPTIDPPLSERTQQVRAAIVHAVSGVDDPADVTPEHLAKITSLSLAGKSITSMKIGDFDGLTALTTLLLHNNSISDISPLAGLTNLETLTLSDSSISDISPLAGMTNLTTLTLNHNDISDISALSGMTKMENLHLIGNDIINISALSGMTSLITLYLRSNDIIHISPLAGMTNLKDLRLAGNDIINIPNLSGLTNLRALSLYGNDIINISALADLTSLLDLKLSDNSISDISALADLTSLTHLSLSGNDISNISPLENLTNLRSLTLDNNSISDYGPLRRLKAAIEADDRSLDLDITIPPENRPPTFVSTSNFTYTIDMSTATVGDNIGAALTATDPDGDMLTFSVGGDDASYFSISSDNSNPTRSGQLQVTQTLIDNTRINYSINVIADDGEGGTAEIAGTIDVFARISTQTTNNRPVFTDGSSTTRSVAENTAAGVNIGNPVEATDTDNDTLTYTLSGTDAASFDIDSTTGQLKTKTALDYEIKTTYTVVVTATDDSGAASNNSATITVTINVTDVEEATIDPPLSERTQQVRDAIVREVPGVSDSADVTAGHLAAITTLDLSFERITSLEAGDFDGLTNLRSLDLRFNSIIDISPLDGLTNLTELRLSFNNIIDISALEGLTNLTTLTLSSNSIIDISPLEDLTNLTELGLVDNNIIDISPLDGLTNLTELRLSDNNIIDISPLEGLTNLTTLELADNNIIDISPLDGLTNLTTLDLASNSNLINISPLDGLTNLTTLDLPFNSIINISPLSGYDKSDMAQSGL